MNTTIEFLDAVKTKHGLISDYSLSKFWEFLLVVSEIIELGEANSMT